jgi:hypothetical protein
LLGAIAFVTGAIAFDTSALGMSARTALIA